MTEGARISQSYSLPQSANADSSLLEGAGVAGNPVSYDGKTYEWTGKQLTKVTAQDGSYTTYSYDTEGLRTKKMQYDANGQMEYQVGYIWSDGKIITQSLGLIIRGTSGGKPTETQVNLDTKYLYEDGSNAPYAVMVNNGEYLFVRNAQGDVTAVVDVNGDTLAEYSYDAWGNVTATYVDDNDLFKAIMCLVCPLTYRGYNYDFTTGLYYLQSRYYNPEWGRFLNVDDTTILVSSVGDPLAANMYAYCKNNPVNNVDYTGLWAEDVHSGYFDKDVTGKKGYYKTSLLYGYYVPYKTISRGRQQYYGTFYWAIEVGYPVWVAKLLGYYSNQVDALFNPITDQKWHFNTFRETSSYGFDSRFFISAILLINAYCCFEKVRNFQNNNDFGSEYKYYMSLGIVLLGYSLHPLQDYYAHTNDRVYKDFFGLWSHVKYQDTDNPIIRWGQLIQARNHTMEVLKLIYDEFYALF